MALGQSLGNGRVPAADVGYSQTRTSKKITVELPGDHALGGGLAQPAFALRIDLPEMGSERITRCEVFVEVVLG